jgi:predicted transcriptional regulator
MPELDTPDLTGLTASLVAAYLRGNSMPVSDVADLINTTHAAMIAVLVSKDQPAEPQKPAVSVKKSVLSHAIICLECGEHKQMLKRHLSTAHGLSVDDYKAKWSLPADYPMTAPNYAGTRSNLAKKIGLGRKPRGSRQASVSAEAEPAAGPQSGQKYPPSRWAKPTS